MKHAGIFLLLAAAFFGMPTHVDDAYGEILSEDEVRALSWPAALPMTLVAASDRMWSGGPDYVGWDPNVWLRESDVVQNRSRFVMSIRNTSIYPVDDVLLLIAHTASADFTLSIGDCKVHAGDFGRFSGAPFGPTGNRPGDGESTLYNEAEGVAFIRIGQGIAPNGTLEIPVDVPPAEGDCMVHFDVYGLRRSKVFCSCPSTSDVTCRSVPSAAATLEEIRGQVKVLFSP